MKGDRQTEGITDLDIADFLLLKLVYGLLQVARGARGVHRSSLQLTLSLNTAQQAHT